MPTIWDQLGPNNPGREAGSGEKGQQSTEHHRHLNDEEFVYILAGRGFARVGDERFEIGAGDFLGYRKSGPAHSLENPFEEDLVYLMAGTRCEHRCL